MGMYRFFLAFLVVVSHLWGRELTLGYNLGVIAVVSFLLLSGYVMAALIGRYYASPGKVLSFYADRFFRLYPQYAFYLLATLALIYVRMPPEQFFLSSVSTEMVLLNFLMLPLGFINYIPGLFGCTLIPPAWSLGLEICFYLVIPFIIIYRLGTVMYVLSVLVFVLACFGVLNPEIYGYRLLPGVLFIFLCGWMIYAHRDMKTPPLSIVLTWVLALSLFAIVYTVNMSTLGYNKEVLVGILVGIPAVWFLRKQKTGQIDQLLGDLSYGVFLNHYMIKWAIDTYCPVNGFGFVSATALLGVSMVLAYLSFRYIESPFLSYRRKLRKV